MDLATIRRFLVILESAKAVDSLRAQALEMERELASPLNLISDVAQAAINNPSTPLEAYIKAVMRQGD